MKNEVSCRSLIGANISILFINGENVCALLRKLRIWESVCVRYKDGKGICSNACHFTPFPTHLQACVFWFVRGCFPVCQQKFFQTCADVFQLLRRSFTAHSYGLYDPQLWVVRPTIMGCTTHGYGLYDPQLWAVKVVLTMGKTSPHERENMYRQRQKKRFTRLPRERDYR